MNQPDSARSINERILRVETLNTHLAPARNLVIIPTYNERGNIPSLLKAISELNTPIDVLVADDASPDGTAQAVIDSARMLPRRIYLMHRKGKFGLGVCYLDAFRWVFNHLVDYNCLIQMDADFSHDPNILPALIKEALAHGLAIGSRYVEGGSTPDWNQRRIFLSRGGNLYARSVLRLFRPKYSIQDNTAGFMAWRRETLETVIEKDIPGDGYAFLTVLKFLTFLQGYAIKEVPIVFRDRRLGVSKLNKHIILEAILMPWRLGWTFYVHHRNV